MISQVSETVNCPRAATILLLLLLSLKSVFIIEINTLHYIIINNNNRRNPLFLHHGHDPVQVCRAHVCGVVSAVGAYALAFKERADVAADLVDVVGLIDGDDFEEHGL